MLIEEGKSIWYILNDELDSANPNDSIQTSMQQKYKLSACIIYVILFLITMASLSVIGLLAYIFKVNKSLVYNSVNIFILNIVFVDLLRCIVLVPIYSTSIHLSFDELTGSSSSSTNMSSIDKPNYLYLIVLCNLNMTLTVLFEIVQLFSFLAISYERFRIVHSPFINANKRFFLAKLWLASTWFVSVVLSASIVFAISYISSIYYSIKPNEERKYT